MQITERSNGNATIFTLNGRVDSQGAVDLDLALHTALDEGKTKLVLDMGDVPYINSSGLRTLAEVLTVSKEQGGQLVLAGLNARVLRVLQIVGFDNFFEIYEDADSAAAAF